MNGKTIESMDNFLQYCAQEKWMETGTMLKVNGVIEWWQRGMAAENEIFWQLSMWDKR